MANALVEALARRLDRRAAERMQKAEALAATLSGQARLVDITRNGRVNLWTFERGGMRFTIETMGMLADDVSGWRRDLLEPQRVD